MHIHVPNTTAPVSSKNPSILPSVATSTVVIPLEPVTVAVESVTLAIESVIVAVESVVAPESRIGHLIMILDHDLHALNHMQKFSF